MKEKIPFKTGQIFKWNELTEMDPHEHLDNVKYNRYAHIDDGKEVFFELMRWGIRCIVMDYWNGGKDDPNPRLKIVSVWERRT